MGVCGGVESYHTASTKLMEIEGLETFPSTPRFPRQLKYLNDAPSMLSFQILAYQGTHRRTQSYERHPVLKVPVLIVLALPES